MKTEFADHYARMINMVRRKEPFAFARYGDGEFKAMLHWKGCNTDKHHYFPEMGDELKRIFLSQPPYMVGTMRMARQIFADEPRLTEILKLGNCPNETFHHANITGDRLVEWFTVLKNRSVVLVGPDYMDRLTACKFEHVKVPRRQAYQALNSIVQEACEYLGKGRVFLFCAGMPAKIMIHQLWEKDPRSTFVDMGSALDPHVGRCCRTYHYNLPWVGK